jgi:hypothetical protein
VILYFIKVICPFPYKKSKTDIYRDGDRIVIAWTDNKLCPVQNLENYLEWSCNFGISDRLFKRHGRWKSETAKDGYVKEFVSDRILVSLNLNL